MTTLLIMLATLYAASVAFWAVLLFKLCFDPRMAFTIARDHHFAAREGRAWFLLASAPVWPIIFTPIIGTYWFDFACEPVCSCCLKEPHDWFHEAN